MICNCGGVTESVHKVQMSKVVVGEYQRCPACGRILWLWKSEQLDSELKQEQELESEHAENTKPVNRRKRSNTREHEG